MLVTAETMRTKEVRIKQLLHKQCQWRRHNGPCTELSRLNDGVTATGGEVHMKDYLKKSFK